MIGYELGDLVVFDIVVDPPMSTRWADRDKPVPVAIKRTLKGQIIDHAGGRKVVVRSESGIKHVLSIGPLRKVVPK